MVDSILVNLSKRVNNLEEQRSNIETEVGRIKILFEKVNPVDVFLVNTTKGLGETVGLTFPGFRLDYGRLDYSRLGFFGGIVDVAITSV